MNNEQKVFNDGKIKDIYVAGLLHDIGKYIHKINGNRASHQILSQMFVLNNKDLCDKLEVNVDKIANIVANHHDNPSVPGEGVLIAPGQSVTADMIKKASSNYELKDFSNEISIIKRADSMSAASDRASEISGEKGTSSPYAPLISPVGKVFGKRLALKHGRDYEVYEFTGETDTKEVVESLDNNCTEHIVDAFKHFMLDMNKVSDLNELDSVLKAYWSTVNANTWRPAGEKLGNTTTSLYDHSKTTAAIAACIYINKLLRRGSIEDIDVIHLVYNGYNNNLKDITDEALERYGLCRVNTISCTENEAYIMIPSGIRTAFKNHLEKLNKDAFERYGETLDYSFGNNWKFKDCREVFKSRFDAKHSGILDVIGDVQPGIDESSVENKLKRLDGKFIAGYSIEGFDYILGKILNDNDSISKVSTTFRIFEYFNNEVERLLVQNGGVLIKSELAMCVYAVDSVADVHKMERYIHLIFNRFVNGVTGLYFTYMKYDRYKETDKTIANELETRLTNFNAEAEVLKNGSLSSTVIINNVRYKISALAKYNDYMKIMAGVDKSFLYNIKHMIEDLVKYNSNKDASHLIGLSRINYLRNKTKEEDKRKFIDYLQIGQMYNRDKDKIENSAFYINEALKSSLTNIK